VSVVTRTFSDDANAVTIDGRTLWMRVARLDHAYAFHCSTDGQRWSLVRVFTLGEALDGHQVGFEAQSPNGEGCTVSFESIRFVSERLVDLRDGSVAPDEPPHPASHRARRRTFGSPSCG
jgi:uncharacterized protein